MTGAVDRRYPLDVIVARQLRDPNVRWGMGEAATVVFGFFGVLIVGAVIVVAAGLPGVTFTVIAYAAELGLLIGVGRTVVRQTGSWAAAFGWGRPESRDVPLIGLWLVISFLSRILVTVVVEYAVPQARSETVSNVPVHVDTPTIVISAIFSILLAPPLEELIFRGIALRAVMRRYGFLPAAFASSILFGLGHAWQEPTPASALLITVTMATFGFTQCWLVRRTGRLGPAIAVHALLNTLAFGLAFGA